MCSFLITDLAIHDFDYVNYYMKLRGPDKTNEIKIQNLTFIHNILSITGPLTPQPFIDDENEIICIYNGEIYNYGDYSSDGECLIPMYKTHGPSFTTQLDGEFAIALFDFKKDLFIISTDPFATKPLWISFDGGFGIASYKSALDRLGLKSIEKIPANHTNVYKISTKEKVSKFDTYTFNLKQFKYNYDDWVSAFEAAIKKRTHNLTKSLFIGLSSGYDSGGISCALNNLNIPYTAYSVMGKENEDIIQKRHLLINKLSKSVLITEDRQPYQTYINKNVEEFYYTIYSSSSDYNEFDKRIQDDSGSIGLSMVCDYAKKENNIVSLSGSGADEIFSDYGFMGTKIFNHSNFGGYFPEKLESIFPWASFYGSTMESYLVKEEYIAGSYGIETRYPYLDKQVVQEFLWLSPYLKNLTYKSVIFYLNANQYPLELMKKRGF